MKLLQLALFLWVFALPPLSGMPITPETTLDYNPLLAADSGVRLNTAPKFVRLDRGAQLSAVYTSLLPEAMRYSVLDPAASASVPGSPVVGPSATPRAAPDVELMNQVEQIPDFVSFMGRSLPRQDFLVEISRELLGISHDATFDVEQVIVAASSLLASAFSRA